jgi:hypothetical protein
MNVAIKISTPVWIGTDRRQLLLNPEHKAHWLRTAFKVDLQGLAKMDEGDRGHTKVRQ